MRSLALLLALAAAPAAATDMQGMSGMPPMTLPPMPAIYAGTPDKPGAPLFEGYGDHTHKIATANPKTQAYFDQGVRMLFAFNHAEAIRSFREGARLDPGCAMCWWGVAFALGPNINLPMMEDAPAPAWAALEMARSLEPKASPEEVAWIEALATRYAKEPPANRHDLDEAFASAMGKVWRDYPNDLDAGVFYSEAMMDTQPWDYWEMGGTRPKGHGADIVATLESVLAKEPLHQGALHLYIHAVEASTTPERAEAAADKLEPLMPSAGHIVHMPSHIYYRVGRYEDAMKVNALAATRDEEYIAACKAQGFYPLAYYSHNIHFLWTSAEMLGRYDDARSAGERLMRASEAGLPMAANLPPVQLYRLVPVATELRFGHWQKVLDEARPGPSLKIDQAVSLYARGVAYAHLRQLPNARVDRTRLEMMIAHDEFKSIDAFGVPGTKMAKLALALLDGEIAHAGRHIDKAIAHYREARAIETSLPYTEPPYWHQPVSHILGAELMTAKKPKEAEAVYRDSLMYYRLDAWALHGLAASLTAQGRDADAAPYASEFEKMWPADAPKPNVSRF
ncbi:MAG TPA: hypothetical protein VG889_20005 [Rhizomicrobium sp.]|nr:hypothetical protein [Rhizomicrobium sp.]